MWSIKGIWTTIPVQISSCIHSGQQSSISISCCSGDLLDSNMLKLPKPKFRWYYIYPVHPGFEEFPRFSPRFLHWNSLHKTQLLFVTEIHHSKQHFQKFTLEDWMIKYSSILDLKNFFLLLLTLNFTRTMNWTQLLSLSWYFAILPFSLVFFNWNF